MIRPWRRRPSRAYMLLVVALATPIVAAAPADARIHSPYVGGVHKAAHPSTYTWGGKQQPSRVGTPGVWELDASNGSEVSTFKLQGDGNLVLTANGHVAWASGTNGKLTSTGYLYFADDGQMILYASQYGGVVWSATGTSTAADYFAVLRSARGACCSPRGSAQARSGRRSSRSVRADVRSREDRERDGLNAMLSGIIAGLRVVIAYKEARERIKLAHHVLQGRPLMYKIKVEDGSVEAEGPTWIYRCHFIGKARAPFVGEAIRVPWPPFGAC